MPLHNSVEAARTTMHAACGVQHHIAAPATFSTGTSPLASAASRVGKNPMRGSFGLGWPRQRPVEGRRQSPYLGSVSRRECSQPIGPRSTVVRFRTPPPNRGFSPNDRGGEEGKGGGGGGRGGGVGEGGGGGGGGGEGRRGGAKRGRGGREEGGDERRRGRGGRGGGGEGSKGMGRK